jgi:hypothetical protein
MDYQRADVAVRAGQQRYQRHPAVRDEQPNRQLWHHPDLLTRLERVGGRGEEAWPFERAAFDHHPVKHSPRVTAASASAFSSGGRTAISALTKPSTSSRADICNWAKR